MGTHLHQSPPEVQAPESLRRTKLGIGLPVFNGERYLQDALDSLLAQSFTNFEVVIVDNASTDRTPQISRDYEARDSRVRYHRNPENIGAGRNHNLAFELTSGVYFKWMTHDDLMDPCCLERCVEALADDPGAVLAYPRTTIVDENGRPLGKYSPSFATDASLPSVRFASMLEEHKCVQIYGVIRRSTLEQTKLIGLYAHGDGVLLSHLALLGRFIEIPEFLFKSRQHPDRSMRMIGDYWSYAVWFDPKYRGKLIFPHWRMFAEYLRVAARSPVERRDRVRVLAALLRVVHQRWRLLRGDILYHLRPVLLAAGVPARFIQRKHIPAGDVASDLRAQEATEQDGLVLSAPAVDAPPD